MSSASEPILSGGKVVGGGSGSGKKRLSNSESAQSIGSAGMIVMGPGLMSGVGPTIVGKGGISTTALKKKRRKRRPASASSTRKTKKLPPWARSKAPDYQNMSEDHLRAVRIFHKLFAVLEKRRARSIDIFREFDNDESGTIDGKEFRLGCKSLGITIKKKDRIAVFQMIDDDGSGEPDCTESSN